MKLSCDISRSRGSTGITLIECVVYIAVFMILSGIAMGSFYLCWDHSKSLIGTTDDISRALRAGELWRADVRTASGAINIEKTASGETVKIPEGEKEILYSFAAGQVRRQIASSTSSELLLSKVKSSEMKSNERGGVAAWQWELELLQRPKGPRLSLLFTFEAAQKPQ